MKEEEFEAFLRRKAEEILNMVAALVIDETADNVMEDEEEGQLIGAPGASPPTNPTPAPTLGPAATTTFSPSPASGDLPTTTTTITPNPSSFGSSCATVGRSKA
jgi:hypothetical protein